MAKVLVVDDEEFICQSFEEFLRILGHEVQTSQSGEQALVEIKKFLPDIVITDLRMNGMSGLDLLTKLQELYPGITVVIMTGQGSVDSAVLAIRKGAYDYLLKPFTPDQLEDLIHKINHHRNKGLGMNEAGVSLGCEVYGQIAVSSKNPKMCKILDTVKKVSVKDSTVLITGESGTGKTALARYIHDLSLRSKGPFAVVNCATLSENLLESELFGHVRGAFTGAIRDKLGRLQLADSGTVFLDEVGEVSPSLQTKLLRFLQDREFERVGDTKTIRVNVRILAATNKNLESEVKKGSFREDLYFRLNVFDLRMPPLRERPEDILLLARQLLQEAFQSTSCPLRPLSDSSVQAILQYDWPGNIRELRNALERAAILCSGTQIELEDLPDRIMQIYASKTLMRPLIPSSKPCVPVLSPSVFNQAATFSTAMISRSSMPASQPKSLRELEKEHIQFVLEFAESLDQAAEILGINLSTLWRKRRRYGLTQQFGLQTELQAAIPAESEMKHKMLSSKKSCSLGSGR